MANPNISLLGATYSGVSGVKLPTSGGGTATFPWVEGSQTITENGTVDVSSLAEVVVNVAGGGGAVTQDAQGFLVLSTSGDAPTLIAKAVTQNGTYTAEDDGVDGFSSVSVNVSGGPPIVYGTITIVNSTANDVYLENLFSMFGARLYAVNAFVAPGDTAYSNQYAPAQSTSVFYTVNSALGSAMSLEIDKPHTCTFSNATNMTVDDSEEWWTTIAQDNVNGSYSITITVG